MENSPPRRPAARPYPLGSSNPPGDPPEPAASGAWDTPQRGIAACSAIPRRHILLVDDEPVIAFALGEVLQTFGHRVSIATHALLALDIDSGDGADLLITDLNMPDVDGLDLIRRIRAKRPALPVIVLTGRPPPGGRAALAGGDRAPTELLFKPATPTELHQAIQRVLGW